MIRVGIYGTTGYTGVELVKILQRHPQAEIVFATSASSAGKSLRDLFAAAPPIPLIHPDHAPLDQIEVAFLCLGHGDAAAVAVKLLQAGVRVIDLSADFRLKDAAAYQHWYHHPHPCPELLASAVYGLTELPANNCPRPNSSPTLAVTPPAFCSPCGRSAQPTPSRAQSSPTANRGFPGRGGCPNKTPILSR
ncbi:MAG: hypothetical protein IPL78_19390 [Chloroflexi bacterium]|nr:hypothetical protein [Chloroflexota bacterium]